MNKSLALLWSCIMKISTGLVNTTITQFLYEPGQSYEIGDTFTAKDGCNKCLCTEDGLACTAKPCFSSGFAKPSSKPLYGECMYGNGWYRFQSQWKADDNCNTCVCVGIGNYRGPHICTTSKCCQGLNNDKQCTYNQRSYQVGDTITVADHCNTCVCTEHGFYCTRKSCFTSGFATAHSEPLYGECHYNGGWYHYRDQWLATDKCNTCFCDAYGNYQGHHVCTSGKCCAGTTKH